MMNSNYIYIGMIVSFDNQDCLVLSKNKGYCTIVILDTREVVNAGYDQLSSLSKAESELNSYNRNIRGVMSNPMSLFSKNEDKDYTFEDGSKVWFTSDTHFFHDNIIRFCDRPGGDVYGMNEMIIENWNNVVKEDDTVFHLGDFAWGGSTNWTSVLERLNGHIHLIVGNHDVKNLRQGYQKYFESISFQKQITVENRKIYLNHYPLLTWGGIYRRPEDQVWQLFGHVHSKNHCAGQDSPRLNHLLTLQYDVGVDNNDYRPINFHQVSDIINKQINKQSQEL